MAYANTLPLLAERLPFSLKRLMGPGPLVIGVRIVAAALALLAQILASRLIGADEFGRYALTLVWLLILGHLATLGTNQLICRFLAGYTAKDQPEHAVGLLRFALALAGCASLSIALIGLALVNSGLFGLSPSAVTLATMALLFVPLLTLEDYLEAISRGLDRPLLGIAPAFLVRHLALILGVGSAFVFGLGADAIYVLSFTLAGLVITVVLQASLLYASLRRAIGRARPVYQSRFWLKTALPIAMIDASEVLFKNGDVLILGLFLPPELVAVYFAATRLSQILDYVPYGVSAVTAQKYAAFQALGDRPGLQALISKAALANSALSVCGALVIVLAAPFLLALFGEGFEVGAPLVLILALGLVGSALLGPGEDVLNMLGQERICSLVHVIVLVVAVALHLVVIPAYGVVGAALVTASAFILRGMLLSLFAYIRLDLRLPVGTGFFSPRSGAVTS